MLKNLGTGEVLKAADLSVDFDPVSRVASWTFPGLDGAVLPLGNFSATLLAAGVTDADGNPLAGDYTYDFTTVPEPAAGALIAACAAITVARRRRNAPTSAHPASRA